MEPAVQGNPPGGPRLIGVLDIQGDVEKHVAALRKAGAPSIRVKTVESLERVSGLVIPGGESTTIGMLLERFELMEPLRARILAGMPVFGTCAGVILLAREIEGSPQPRLGGLDVAVRRNAYGRQVDSFESTVPVPAVGGDPVRAVFIRAPAITAVGPGVEVMAVVDSAPVLVREGKILGATFHPELTDDTRIHSLFLDMVARG